VAATVSLEALSDLTGHDFSRGDIATVGGLVMEILGRVPHPGESLTITPYRVVVEKVVRRRIQRVYLEPLEASVPAEDDQ
jgi:CBS domain containing-hemolysin-like protein